MPDRTHIFVTDEGDYGFSLVSPQLPGFAFGRPTRAELLSDYQEALHREGVRGDVIGHWQIRGNAADGQEYIIRWATDSTGETRQEVGNRVLRVLTDSSSVKQIAGHHQPDRLGVLNFVCCLASDTIGWLAEQLDAGPRPLGRRQRDGAALSLNRTPGRRRRRRASRS